MILFIFLEIIMFMKRVFSTSLTKLINALSSCLVANSNKHKLKQWAVTSLEKIFCQLFQKKIGFPFSPQKEGW